MEVWVLEPVVFTGTPPPSPRPVGSRSPGGTGASGPPAGRAFGHERAPAPVRPGYSPWESYWLRSPTRRPGRVTEGGASRQAGPSAPAPQRPSRAPAIQEGSPGRPPRPAPPRPGARPPASRTASGESDVHPDTPARRRSFGVPGSRRPGAAAEGPTSHLAGPRLPPPR